MSSNLTPLESDGGFNTTGNITGGNITTGGIANVNAMNISQSIRWDYSGSQIYEDGALVISSPGILAQGNSTAQFEFNDGQGNSSGLYSTIEESIVYSVENVIVRANNSSTQQDWTFDTTGNLTVPGNITGANVVTANVFSGKELTIISNVAETANVSAINIIGSNTGNELPAYNPGVTIHISGNQDLPARIYLDAIGYSNTTSTNAYPAFVGRAARGTVDAPSQILAGDIIARFAGNPYNVDGFNTFTNTRIELVAAEDQTETTRGTQIEFWNTPNGSNTIAKLAVFNSTGIRLTGTNLDLVDDNDNPLVAISNTGNITFNGSSTLSLNDGFHVNTVGTNNGNANMVNYVGGAFVYGPALKDYAGNIGANTISATGNITGGNAIILGNSSTGVYALDVGAAATFLSNTVASFTANVNNYTQLTLQNLSTGADATADFILTADNGNDTVNYSDFGIINSGYDNATPTNSLGNIVYAADTYLYAQGNTGNTSQSGGNLAIGTTTSGKNVKIFAGGVTNSAVVANISNTGVAVTGTVSATGNITTAGSFVGNGAALTNVTVSVAGNIVGTQSNVTLVAGSYTYTFDNTGIVTLPAPPTGNEGAEIDFTKAGNSTLSGNTVVFDQYVDRFRFFESGGTNRGVYIDFTQAAAGVGTLLNNRVSGFVNAGTFVTMDLIKATVTTSGQRGLSLATVSGTLTYNISATYALSNGAVGGASLQTQTLTTSATTSIFGWSFPNAGDTATYILTDTTNSRCYRITLMVGSSYNNNMITIERLI